MISLSYFFKGKEVHVLPEAVTLRSKTITAKMTVVIFRSLVEHVVTNSLGYEYQPFVLY